jgi:hypothetical protein
MEAEQMEPKELRAAYDALTANHEAAQKELSALRQENRTYGAKEAFREAKLDPAQAELFVYANGDSEITPEAIQEFADKFKLAPVPEAQSEEPQAPDAENAKPKAADTGLSMMSRGSTRAGEGGQQPPGTKDDTMTTAEWTELYKRDRNAAELAVKNGKVSLREDNWYAQDHRR